MGEWKYSQIKKKYLFRKFQDLIKNLGKTVETINTINCSVAWLSG